MQEEEQKWKDKMNCEKEEKTSAKKESNEENEKNQKVKDMRNQIALECHRIENEASMEKSTLQKLNKE